MGAPGTETPTQKRPRTYSRHGRNTLRRLHVVETTVRWWSFRVSAPGEIEAANGPYRGKKGTVLVGLGGYQMFDSLAIDRDGHICVATFISGVAATSGPTTKTSPFN